MSPLESSTATSHLALRVRFCETDLMGIVHHGQYLTYFEAGRVEWLRRRGITYADWARSHIHLPVVEAHARYRAPARFDDELVVETRLAQLQRVSLRFEYSIRRGGDLLAEGYTRLACVNGEMQLCPMEEAFAAQLRGPELASIRSADTGRLHP